MAIFNQLNDSCDSSTHRQYHSRAIDSFGYSNQIGYDQSDNDQFNQNCDQKHFGFEGKWVDLMQNIELLINY